jgi:myo-inositol catabolism protein IolC
MAVTDDDRGMAPTDDRALLILAADHRNSLERELYGLAAPPTPDEAAKISADKLLIYQALLDAAPSLGDDVQPGLLVDEQYGAGVAELAAASGGAVNLSMPIEASGQEWFQFAYGQDWRRHAEFFAADHPKVLVRDNPGFDPAEREAQAERLAEVSAWAKGSGRNLILELLVPATDADNATADHDTRRYDDEVRPGLTLQVMAYLQDHDVEPGIWKVEGLDGHDDAVAVSAAAKRGGRDATCIVLGRHAGREDLDHWLEVAAPIPGWTGFAIGRSIWWDPLHAHLHHHTTSGEARRRITATYVELAKTYIAARQGRSGTDPEFW